MTSKDYYAPILRNWVYPIAQCLQGRDFYPVLNAALQDQFLSNDELRELQFRKVCALIDYAYLTVPYYHRVFNEIGFQQGDIKTWQDFQKIPLLTKELLRENAESLFRLSWIQRCTPSPPAVQPGHR